MNGDAFQRARPGDKMQIAAAAWNACLDAAEAHRRGPGRGRPIEQYRQADIVLCKNTSGADVARFGVLGIAGVVISPTDSLNEFQSQVAVTGTTPTTAHRGKFVVCLEPIAAGAIGRAWISGVCQVQVDITDVKHTHADVKPSELDKLQSGGSWSGSARILYRQGTGTGTKWCVVRLGEGNGTAIRVGKVSADWAVGTCAAVKVWERVDVDTPCVPIHCSGLGNGEISGIPVHLCEETIDDVANLSHDVAANSWVVIGQAANGRWYLLEAGKEEGSCRQTIGGEDITTWPGWNGSIVQLLGHDENGCLKWFDSEECEEPSPGTP